MQNSLRLARSNGKNVIQSYLMLSPSFIGLCLFVIYPILWTLRYCLFRYSGYGDTVYVGLYNFVRAFTRTPKFWESVGNSFVFAFGKLAVELPLALFLAVLLNKAFKGRNFFRTVYFLPTIISVAIVGVVFYFLFAAHNGIINGFLKALSIINADIDWFSKKDSGILILCIASIWANFGLNMIFFLSGLQSIPQDVYESAVIDGANGWKQFWSITLPMLGPVLVIVVMNAFLGSLKVTDLVLVLTNGAPGGHTETMMSYIYKLFFQSKTQPDFGFGAALIVICSAILGIITVLYLRASKKYQDIY